MASDASPERPAAEPLAYFLTVACYGTRLHGDARGAVDRAHNAYRGRLAPPDPKRERLVRLLMAEDAMVLNPAERATALREIQRTCAFRGWTLHAAHVRTTHLHVVVTAAPAPETVMGEIKAYASRALNARFGLRKRRWARHASTAWLWDQERLRRAMDYVVLSQGEPMDLFVDRFLWPEYA
ncbi:MAG: transposase [Bryobacterales bacterium]|nr:transposase [Bryobacterales bacterium]